MQYWLVVTSPEDFRHDREELGFTLLGLPLRFKKKMNRMNIGDKVVYYIMKLQKFGSAVTITGDYYEDDKKVWTNEEKMWPARRPTSPNIVLEDDELVDAKRLVPNLTFVAKPEVWGSYFQGSIKTIPEEDFRLIESEMKKMLSDRPKAKDAGTKHELPVKISEEKYEREIMGLTLEAKSLHDRIGEMLEQIGSWMEYNTQTRHKITPDHAYELDVAWLSGKNPEVAIEVQISGNITEAKDRLAQARKFNYRKVIMVLRESDMARLNRLMKHEHDLRSWMEAWSIGSVYEMYVAGEEFFRYFHKLKEAVYKEKKELELIE